MSNYSDGYDFVSAMRGLHRLQENGATGERQDAFLRLHGIEMPPPPPDVNKPAFAISAQLKQLVLEKRCPTCSNPVVMADLSTELARREYSISGMCNACQTSVFGQPKTEPEPRALNAAEVDQFKTLLSQLGIFQPAAAPPSADAAKAPVEQQELFVGEQTLEETADGEAFFDNNLDAEDAVISIAAREGKVTVPGNPPPITNPGSLPAIHRPVSSPPCRNEIKRRRNLNWKHVAY